MTQDKHSPFPWQFDVNPHGCAVAKDGVSIATTYETAVITGNTLPYEANATFIVRAVNNHYQLVEALESIANNTCCDGCQEAALVARQALSNAKGGDDE